MSSGFFPKFNVQPKISEKLLHVCQKNVVPQTYLFYGNEGVGKFYYALEFAKTFFCTGSKKPCNECANCRRISDNNHPDIKIIFSEKYSEKIGAEKILNPFEPLDVSRSDKIKIDVFRGLKEFVSLKTLEYGKRIIIINNFELATVQGSNAFLKFLEEPDKDTIIILTTTSTSNILPTILSRIQLKIFFPNLSKDNLRMLADSGAFSDYEISDKSLDAGSYVKAIKELKITKDFHDVENVLKQIISLFYNASKFSSEALYKNVFLIKKNIEKYRKNKEIFELILNKIYEILYKFIILQTNRGKSNIADFFINLPKAKQIKIFEIVLNGKKMFLSNVNPLNVIQLVLLKTIKIVKE